MGAVFVTDNYGDHDLAVGRHTAPFVFLVEKGVHPLHHPLSDARGLAEPDRRADDENVGSKQLPAQARPVIAFALVRFDARLNIVIRSANDFASGTLLGEFTEQLLHLSLIHISEPTRRTPISYA